MVTFISVVSTQLKSTIMALPFLFLLKDVFIFYNSPSRPYALYSSISISLSGSSFFGFLNPEIEAGNRGENILVSSRILPNNKECKLFPSAN